MKISSFFKTFQISARGLSAEKKRLAVTAENIANAKTTRTADGTPYRRKVLTQKVVAESRPFSGELRNAKMRLRTSSGQHFARPANLPSGVDPAGLSEIKTRVVQQNDFRKVYEPGHPDADENGMVAYPAINVVSEMLELISASRTYEANVTVMDATKKLAKRSLSI